MAQRQDNHNKLLLSQKGERESNSSSMDLQVPGQANLKEKDSKKSLHNNLAN